MTIFQQKHTQHVREQAAKWFARMQNASPDHPDRGQFEAWLIGDPAHTRAYANLSKIWGRFEHKDDLQAIAAMVDDHRHTKAQRSAKTRLKAVKSIALAAIVTLGSLLGMHFWDAYQAQPVMQLASTTPIGTLRIQKLQDGSELTLNADTEVEVTFYRDRRLVRLKRGEVIFNVAKNPERPFMVETGYARVTVLGTRFVVNRLNKLVRVSVDHGKVQVQGMTPSGATAGAPLLLVNGQVAEAKPQHTPYRVERSAADAFGFVSGTLAFEQADLAEIAEELSRYRKQPIHYTAASKIFGPEPKVTALVQIKTLESFLQLLPRIAPVSLVQGKGETLISAKQ